MSVVKLLIRENGVYVEDAKLDHDFIDNLQKILSQMGAPEIDDSEIVRLIRNAKSSVIQILSELPENHDAGITFEKSGENQSQIIATIIPPHGTGSPLTIQDINERIEIEGFSAISVFADNLLDAIKKQKSEAENYSFLLGEFPPPLIKVDISPDEMSAHLTIKKFREGQKIILDDILNALNNAKVVEGIMMEKITEIAENNSSVDSELIARGQNAIDGESGEIVFNFDARKEHAGPQIDTEGRADYHHLNLFENVKKGDLLCQVIPPGKGKTGYKVTGVETPPKPGRECIMPQGQNTEIDPADPLKLIASIDGCPKLAGGKVIVEPAMNIRGDVGVATGDIDFVGSMQISGGITDGYSVKVKGDVTINGPCESASITATGNVTLQRGMRSNENGFISSGGEVHATFVEGVTIQAKGDVIIRDYCYHCNIKSGKSVKVFGKKGYITGGKIEAKEHLIARRLGSQACPRTEIFVDPWVENEKDIENSSEATSRNDVQKTQEINQPELSAKEQEQTGETETEAPDQLYVAVVDIVYPNVLVLIRDAKIITKEEIAGVKFVYKLGRIEMNSYEHEEGKEQ